VVPSPGPCDSISNIHHLLSPRISKKEVGMGEKAKKELKKAVRTAELSEIDLESVSGGTCDEACRSGCAACCETGSANRLLQQY
jgi:hypothetical protein